MTEGDGGNRLYRWPDQCLWDPYPKMKTHIFWPKNWPMAWESILLVSGLCSPTSADVWHLAIPYQYPRTPCGNTVYSKWYEVPPRDRWKETLVRIGDASHSVSIVDLICTQWQQCMPWPTWYINHERAPLLSWVWCISPARQRLLWTSAHQHISDTNVPSEHQIGESRQKWGQEVHHYVRLIWRGWMNQLRYRPYQVKEWLCRVGFDITLIKAPSDAKDRMSPRNGVCQDDIGLSS